MTVAELIEALGKHDPATMVVISGYEGGVTTVVGTVATRIALNVNADEWCNGEHETLDDDETPPDSAEIVDAVRIGGKRR